jgi:hypothetical protein
MNVQTPVTPELVGTIRRFGPHGVLYEIVRILDDKRAFIRVLDTGEETSYPLGKLLSDPAG